MQSFIFFMGIIVVVFFFSYLTAPPPPPSPLLYQKRQMKLCAANWTDLTICNKLSKKTNYNMQQINKSTNKLQTREIKQCVTYLTNLTITNRTNQTFLATCYKLGKSSTVNRFLEAYATYCMYFFFCLVSVVS